MNGHAFYPNGPRLRTYLNFSEASWQYWQYWQYRKTLESIYGIAATETNWIDWIYMPLPRRGFANLADVDRLLNAAREIENRPLPTHGQRDRYL